MEVRHAAKWIGTHNVSYSGTREREKRQIVLFRKCALTPWDCQHWLDSLQFNDKPQSGALYKISDLKTVDAACNVYAIQIYILYNYFVLFKRISVMS